MSIIDPHIDIASIYDETNISADDFFSDRTDIPVSLEQLQKNEISIVGMTLFMDPNLVKTTMFDGVMQYYEFYNKILARTDKLIKIEKSLDLQTLQKEKIGFFYSIEGFECFREIDDFELFYNQVGVRSFGITWEGSNDYAHGNGASVDLGISTKGKELLKIMSKYKLLLDTAHLGQNSFKNLDKYFDGTIINTHSCSRTINPASQHNLTDEQIDLIVERKGIVCLLPSKEEAGGEGKFEDLYKHVDYISSKWGIEYVGLCSDIFPSVLAYIEDINDVSVIRSFRDFLLTKMNKELVDKIAYKNFHDLLSRSI